MSNFYIYLKLLIHNYYNKYIIILCKIVTYNFRIIESDNTLNESELTWRVPHPTWPRQHDTTTRCPYAHWDSFVCHISTCFFGSFLQRYLCGSPQCLAGFLSLNYQKINN